MRSKMHRIPKRNWVYNHDSGNRQFDIISNLKACARGVLVNRSSIPISGDFGLANQQSYVWTNLVTPKSETEVN